jgi:hypothetical protein
MLSVLDYWANVCLKHQHVISKIASVACDFGALIENATHHEAASQTYDRGAGLSEGRVEPVGITHRGKPDVCASWAPAPELETSWKQSGKRTQLQPPCANDRQPA